jgi:hypothetical protein
MEFSCRICHKKFLTRGGLTQHTNAKHRGKTSLSHNEPVRQRPLQSPREVTRPEHDAILWNTPIVMPIPITSQEKSASQDDIVEMEDIVFNENPTQEDEKLVDVAVNLESKSRYNLRRRVRPTDIIEEKADEEESEIEIPINLEDIDLDPEDLQGATLNDALDAVEGKNLPENIANWPNDAYREFMELIVEGNISNSIGDKIIKFFNKHSDLNESPLPKSTKNGKDYLNQINSPSLNFKEKVVPTSYEVDFTLYYRPIFRAIQTLLQRPKVADNFVHKGILNKDKNSGIRIFGEPYESDWWLETEKALPALNHLLSIILYSDATTFDGLGKTSGHPVFLTLGNLPNLIRNSPEAKVLIGFLPKVQDIGFKSGEAFRSFQREVYHKCFKIMLQPLLEKPDALYFGIKGRELTFAARISFFLADMLEADEVTATYKYARCKMPCHTCMVSLNDLNNMDLSPENMPSRTHGNMQEIVKNGQGKEFSVHPVENAFWKFP